MRLGWNRDEGGVITVFAYTEDGRGAPVADFWITPLVSGLGISRPKAMALQQMFAELLVDAHNSQEAAPSAWECPIGAPGCSENCGNYGCGN